MQETISVTIYTDGSCSGNPGPGGLAVYWVVESGDKVIDKSLIAEPKEYTTNNERELQAFLYALQVAKNLFEIAKRNKSTAKVTILSDSTYCVNSVCKGWIDNWYLKNWRRKGELIPNHQLWKQVYSLLKTDLKQEQLEINWTRGHQNINSGNDLVDKYAVLACTTQKVYRLSMEDFERSAF